MDKKKKQKHTVNKPREQSSMEKKKKNQNQKSKSIHDILPLELIHGILLRVPVKQLGRLKCVSKFWHSLISDPDFAELHYHHSHVPTNTCIFIRKGSMTCYVYLDALFSDLNDALQVREVSRPLKTTRSSYLKVIGSCRGFVLFDRHPNFLVVCNPLTRSTKIIPDSRIVFSREHRNVSLSWKFHLYGFGYDASQDDYVIVVGWQDMDSHDHLDCFSLRTNSWIDFDAALPKPLGVFDSYSSGLFLNGAIHWVQFSREVYKDTILIFDLKERTFSRISAPEQLASSCDYPSLALLGGCLALYYRDFNNCSTHLWVMKEYNVQSSWTFYQIPCFLFRPLYLSRDSDLVGRGEKGFYIYNLRDGKLQWFKYRYFRVRLFTPDVVYTESLLSLPRRH